MAGHLMTWARRQVFKQVPLTSTQRFILLLLADNGSWDDDEETWSAKPFQKTLAEESDNDVRTVQRALKALEDKRVLAAVKRYKPGGAPAGNEYFFNVAVVENPIVAVGNVPRTTRGDILTVLENSRHDTVPPLEISRHDIVSPTPLDSHADKGRHHAAPVDNSGRGDTSVVSGATPVSSPAREVHVRASLNPQGNHQSSSSPPGPTRPDPTAGAVGDDDDDLKSAEMKTPRQTSSQGPTAHRGVNLSQAAKRLNEITGLKLRDPELCWVIDRYLDRVESVSSPTGLVFTSAGREPETLRREIVKAFRGGLDASTVSTPASAAAPATQGVERPAPCPIPGHGASGYRRSNCPACRDLTGDGVFPRSVPESVFQQLSQAGQNNITRYQVPVLADDQHNPAELHQLHSWGHEPPVTGAA